MVTHNQYFSHPTTINAHSSIINIPRTVCRQAVQTFFLPSHVFTFPWVPPKQVTGQSMGEDTQVENMLVLKREDPDPGPRPALGFATTHPVIFSKHPIWNRMICGSQSHHHGWKFTPIGTLCCNQKTQSVRFWCKYVQMSMIFGVKAVSPNVGPFLSWGLLQVKLLKLIF